MPIKPGYSTQISSNFNQLNGEPEGVDTLRQRACGANPRGRAARSRELGDGARSHDLNSKPQLIEWGPRF